ncbi:unnamed protein product, partial [Laminaria digitata]
QVRKWTSALLNGYIQHPLITTDEVNSYITPSSFGQQAGMVGCLTLAHVAYEEAGGRGKGAGAATATVVGGGGECPAVKWVPLHIAAVAAVVGLGALAVAKASKN